MSDPTLYVNASTKEVRKNVTCAQHKKDDMGPAGCNTVCYFVICAALFGFISVCLSDITDTVILNWNEERTASEKIDLVWERMTSNRQSEPWIGVVELLTRGPLFQTDQTERLSQRNTFRPFTNKKKFLHTQGSIAKIKWKSVPNSLHYTGLFDEDETLGTATFSKGSRIPSNSSASWGLGLKLLRDNGPPAASVFCSPTTLLGNVFSTNWNMFDSPLCGHLDIFLGTALLLSARKRPKEPFPGYLWTSYGNALGLSNIADIDGKGRPVEKPNFPFTICFRSPLQLADDFAGQLPWFSPQDQLQHIPSNTLLYEVIAVDNPSMLQDPHALPDRVVKIAEIWTLSEFITSRWADNHWTHQHQKFEEDLELRPEWKPQMTLLSRLMDGFAYETLYKDRRGRQGNLEQMYLSWAPGPMSIFQALTNLESAWQFMDDDIGIIRFQEVILSVLLGQPGSPNPSSTSFDRESTPPFSVTDVIRSYLDSPNKMHSIRDNLPITEEEILTGYSPASIDYAEQFANTVVPLLGIDGHFFTPSSEGLLAVLQDPILNGVFGSIAENFTNTFRLPVTTTRDIDDAVFGAFTAFSSFVNTVLSTPFPALPPRQIGLKTKERSRAAATSAATEETDAECDKSSSPTRASDPTTDMKCASRQTGRSRSLLIKGTYNLLRGPQLRLRRPVRREGLLAANSANFA
eukprot:GHVQ01032831.1.p1 GENE.GHVQ01032831.1~~GHVQ01032831.1.p1  ORF type:complete len:689 (-),score=65.70 GHVQ01032831.1:130-2196(-)